MRKVMVLSLIFMLFCVFPAFGEHLPIGNSHMEFSLPEWYTWSHKVSGGGIATYKSDSDDITILTYSFPDSEDTIEVASERWFDFVECRELPKMDRMKRMRSSSDKAIRVSDKVYLKMSEKGKQVAPHSFRMMTCRNMERPRAPYALIIIKSTKKDAGSLDKEALEIANSLRTVDDCACGVDSQLESSIYLDDHDLRHYLKLDVREILMEEYGDDKNFPVPVREAWRNAIEKVLGVQPQPSYVRFKYDHSDVYRVFLPDRIEFIMKDNIDVAREKLAGIRDACIEYRRKIEKNI